MGVKKLEQGRREVRKVAAYNRVLAPRLTAYNYLKYLNSVVKDARPLLGLCGRPVAFPETFGQLLLCH